MSTGAHINDLRDRVRAAIRQRRKTRVKPDPAPRFDIIYFWGTRWLDESDVMGQLWVENPPDASRYYYGMSG